MTKTKHFSSDAACMPLQTVVSSRITKRFGTGSMWAKYFYPQPHPPGFPGNASNYFMNPPTPSEQPAPGNAAKKKKRCTIPYLMGGTKTIKNKSQTAENGKVGFFKKCQSHCKNTIQSQLVSKIQMKRGSCQDHCSAMGLILEPHRRIKF